MSSNSRMWPHHLLIGAALLLMLAQPRPLHAVSPGNCAQMPIPDTNRSSCANGGAVCLNNGQKGTCQSAQTECNCVVQCKDPGAIATFRTDPITSFPATRTFTPVSDLTMVGVSPAPVTVPFSGSFTASFQAGPSPGQVEATFLSFNLTIPPVTGNSGNSSGTNIVTLQGSSLAIIDTASGAVVEGMLITQTSSATGIFNGFAPFTGVFDFGTGEWTISTQDAAACLQCDVNGDGQVDINDINLIFSARNTRVTPGDVRDVNRNGVIDVNDARICTLACTKPRCAP